MRTMKWMLAAACFGSASLIHAGAQEVSAPPVALDQDVIVVEAPGPELWRVHDRDSEIFILATINALPRGFRWNSRPIAAVLERADRLYVSEPISFGLDDVARLLVTRRDAVRNPDGLPLKDYLPTSLYQRLEATAAQEGLAMDDLELWRPYIAGGRLLGAALQDVGLDSGAVIVRETRRLARRARVRVEEVETMRARPLIDALNAMPIGRDNACLALQLEAIEVQLPALRARADAWAGGDVAALRNFSTLVDSSACLSSLGGSGLTFRDVENRFMATWLTTLSEGLSRPGTRLALISADIFLRPNGLLQQLRAAGYAVEGP